jgi:hypothetical protein
MTQEENEFLRGYVADLETEGHFVYWPPRDTDQTDILGGISICEKNRLAILNAEQINIFFKKKSQGTFFDLGIAFAYGKPIKIINKEDIEITGGKSFENVLLALDIRRFTDKT